MRTMTSNGLAKLRGLNRRQGLALLDRQARAHLRMSGEEFVRRWKAGKFVKRADRPEVMRVAVLLPFAR